MKRLKTILLTAVLACTATVAIEIYSMQVSYAFYFSKTAYSISAYDIYDAYNWFVSQGYGGSRGDYTYTIYANSTAKGTIRDNVYSFTVSGLAPNTQYDIYLKVGGYHYHFWQVDNPPYTLANPPNNLTATAVSPTQVNVSWTGGTGNPAGTRYYISGPTNSYTGTGTSYSSTGLTSGRRYYYYGHGINQDGEYGSYVSTSVVTPINTPSSFTASSTGPGIEPGSIKLSWEHNGNSTNTVYRIVNSANEFIWSGTGTSYIHAGLSTNTAYTYKIMADGTDVDSAYTPVITKYARPHAPTDVVAVATSDTSIRVTWNANGNPAGIVYQLYRNGTSNPIYTGTATEYHDIELESYVYYTYQVRAINSEEQSAFATSNPCLTPDTTAPVFTKYEIMENETEEDGQYLVRDRNITFRINAADQNGGSGIERFIIEEETANGLVSEEYPLDPVKKSVSNLRLRFGLSANMGVKVIKLSVIDACGNRSDPIILQINYINDTNKPDITKFSVNNGAIYTVSTAVTIDGLVKDNTTILTELGYRISNDGGQTFTSGDEDSWPTLEEIPGKPNAFSIPHNITGITIPDGQEYETVYFVLQIKDKQGNIGTATTTIRLMNGPDAAPTPAGNGVGGPIVVGTNQITISDGSLLKDTIKYVHVSKNDQGWMEISKDKMSSGPYVSFTIILSPGDNHIKLKTESNTGKFSEVVDYGHYIYDVTPPQITSFKTASGTRATGSSSIELFIDATDTVTPREALEYSLKVNGAASEFQPLNADGIISCNLTRSGRNDIIITVRDEADKRANASLTVWRLN